MELSTFSELESFLRTYKSWEDEHVYDYNGVVHLLLALIDNLHENALGAELETIGDSMSGSQKGFLLELVNHLSSPHT